MNLKVSLYSTKQRKCSSMIFLKVFLYGFFKWNDISIDVGCMNLFDVVLPGPGFNVFQRNFKLNGGAWD